MAQTRTPLYKNINDKGGQKNMSQFSISFFLYIDHSAVNPQRIKPVQGDQPNSTDSTEAGCVASPPM